MPRSTWKNIKKGKEIFCFSYFVARNFAIYYFCEYGGHDFKNFYAILEKSKQILLSTLKILSKNIKIQKALANLAK
jgi:hypothetical protein